ncbi:MULTISPECIES: hypothetical protein [Erythrobacter]|jgi:hypothetical protein|uniref:hypothetical protein n=1 Tax=Erythrobacter TaxID=1041 RepID=UPI001F281F05|nr:hypothetical protein [Erythrobacter litoralis]MEE4337513.1 hypothetical protein [Erythrobacter sp.]
MPARPPCRAVRDAYAPLAAVTGRIADRLGRERSDAATKQLLGLARLVEWARQAERG